MMMRQAGGIVGTGLKQLLRNNILVVYLALGLLLGIGAILQPNSVSLENLGSVLRWSSVLGMVAIGQTIVMIAGGIDISVGMTVFLVHVLAAGLMRGDDAMVLPVTLLCLVVGAGIGLANGVGVAVFRVSAIVMTLGMSTALNGVVWLYTGGVTRGSVAPLFGEFGRLSLGRYIPLSAVIWIAIALFMAFVMRRTTVGRRFHAVGNNAVATGMSGINVKLTVILSYVLCGMLAAGAGLLLLGYLGRPSLRFSDLYTLGSIAAAAIGGTVFFTGIGSIEGTIAGTIITRFIFNILTMFRVAEAGRMIANGLILVVIVALYSARRRR